MQTLTPQRTPDPSFWRTNQTKSPQPTRRHIGPLRHARVSHTKYSVVIGRVSYAPCSRHRADSRKRRFGTNPTVELRCMLMPHRNGPPIPVLHSSHMGWRSHCYYGRLRVRCDCRFGPLPGLLLTPLFVLMWRFSRSLRSWGRFGPGHLPTNLDP